MSSSEALFWVNASSGVVHRNTCEHLRRVEFPVIWSRSVENPADRACHFCLPDGLPHTDIAELVIEVNGIRETRSGYWNQRGTLQEFVFDEPFTATKDTQIVVILGTPSPIALQVQQDITVTHIVTGPPLPDC